MKINNKCKKALNTKLKYLVLLPAKNEETAYNEYI